jgi:DNA-binding transcriptional MerR regulator
VEKGPDAFRTISEVAEDLDLPQHVLRFWETRFAQIKPLKRGGGRRYYRPDDVDLLRGIRHLLYGEGYTIRGVQQILREQGVRHVLSIGHAVESEEARSAPAFVDSGHPGGGRERGEPAARAAGAGIFELLPSLRPSRGAAPELPRVVEVPIPQRPAPGAGSAGEEDIPPFPFRKASEPGRPSRQGVRPVLDDDAPATSRRPSARARGGDPRAAGENPKLTPEAIRLLKATLYELGECRRMLDQASDEKS